MNILRFNEMTVAPWKNGGGTTRNIAHGAFGQMTAWRISRADVAQNGAFSNYTGLERILTVVSNTGMALEYPDGVLKADPWAPLCFSGALEIYGRLDDGPLTNLNVMFDPTLCTAEVQTLRGPTGKQVQPPRTGMVAYHVLSGRPAFGKESLGVGDTAFLDAPATLALADGDAVLEIVIQHGDHNRDITFSIAAR